MRIHLWTLNALDIVPGCWNFCAVEQRTKAAAEVIEVECFASSWIFHCLSYNLDKLHNVLALRTNGLGYEMSKPFRCCMISHLTALVTRKLVQTNRHLDPQWKHPGVSDTFRFYSPDGDILRAVLL